MIYFINNTGYFRRKGEQNIMLLTDVKVGQTVTVTEIEAKEKIKNFLVSLGCFAGEQITLISILSGNYIVNIKDSRYAIEKKIAKSILVEE